VVRTTAHEPRTQSDNGTNQVANGAIQGAIRLAVKPLESWPFVCEIGRHNRRRNDIPDVRNTGAERTKLARRLKPMDVDLLLFSCCGRYSWTTYVSPKTVL
jgi:hypothetical protein